MGKYPTRYKEIDTSDGKIYFDTNEFNDERVTKVENTYVYEHIFEQSMSYINISVDGSLHIYINNCPKKYELRGECIEFRELKIDKIKVVSYGGGILQWYAMR
jgi:hypothetical protein